MGCGASSGKGGVPSDAATVAPKGGTAEQPPAPAKAPSGKMLTPLYEKTASLGRRPVNDSFRVCSDRKSKQTSDTISLPPINESGSSRPASATRPSSGSSKGGAGGGGKPAKAASLTDTKLPPLPGTAPAPPAKPAPDTSAWRPALQVPRLNSAPLSCLAPPAAEGAESAPGSPAAMPDGTQMHIQHLSSGGGSPAGACAAAAHIRMLTCRTRAPVQALLDAGVAAALVRCLREGPPEAQVEAAWALTNLAAASEYTQVEALCDAEAPQALVALLVGTSSAAAAGSAATGPRAAAAGSSGGAAGAGTGGVGLREQALWALANISGALHPELKTQALAVEVLDAGALAPALAILSSEAAAVATAAELTPADSAHAVVSRASSRSGTGALGGGAAGSPLLRCAAWCVHNLAKHKREKEMVDVIPVITQLLLECNDPEVLACSAWVLAYLGTNEDNKSHLKQALPVLPRLVPWVREPTTALATPSLLCMGTLCTGYMRALDYSQDVVDAGGVPAMLSFLNRASSLGGSRGRELVKEALFAMSNVAGANNATVRAMLEAGVFRDVLALTRSSHGDEEVLQECLYVLTNPWDPLVAVEVPTVQLLFESGILQELSALLDPEAPAARLALLLKGLTDGLKRGQQLMTYAAKLQLLELGSEAAASAPQPSNPVIDLYGQLGTVARIEALNGHVDEDVATRANGILTILKFM